MSTAQYTFLATDLVTNTVLGELFPNTISLDCQLDTVGNMTAGLSLDSQGIRNEDVIARTVPGKTAFWVYRNNTIVWGGIVWTREYVSNTKTLTITGQTFESYAARRFARSWLGNTILTYTNRSMAFVINDLWHKMQGVAHGSIGVKALPTTAIVGDSYITSTIFGYDLTNTVDAIIQDIIKNPNGPDYTITWFEDGNGLPLKQLALGFPIGRPVSVSRFVVDFPGPIQNYDFVENASLGNNSWWAVGDVPTVAVKKAPMIPATASTTPGVAGTIPTIGNYLNQTSLNNGWPLLEGVETYGGTSLPTLNGRAASDGNQYAVPLVTHTTDLTGSDWPPFGSYQMGDYCVVNIVDPRYPSGYTFTKRIVGWSIQPPDTGAGVETITLVYDDPDPSNAPGTTTTTLTGL